MARASAGAPITPPAGPDSTMWIGPRAAASAIIAAVRLHDQQRARDARSVQPPRSALR